MVPDALLALVIEIREAAERIYIMAGKPAVNSGLGTMLTRFDPTYSNVPPEELALPKDGPGSDVLESDARSLGGARVALHA
jgi:hypothetical protein